MGTTTTFAALIAAPNSEKVFLCEVKPGEKVTNFAGCGYAGGAFVALSQTSRNWNGLCVAPDGDVYATVFGGDIYKQTAGTGDFVALSQVSRNWSSICAAPNGNIYACVNGGDIYMQTNGAGDFNALSQTSRAWYGLTAAPNGNIYACCFWDGAAYGDIYMQTNGTGNFVSLSQTLRNWSGLSANSSGDIFACVWADYIYKQTAGTGDFELYNNSALEEWRDLVVAPSGDIYAADGAQYVWIAAGGAGDFDYILPLIGLVWALTATSDGKIYVAVYGGDIYVRGLNTYSLSYLNETVTLADSSTETIRKSVVACELDGTALTAKTSLATVQATAGTYWHDTANSLLYVHAPDSDSPNIHTVIVYFWVYFATKGIILDSKYYEPYIAQNGIPSLSQESQDIHWGASQISSGSVVLLNGRGYFDQIAKRWIWNNKEVKILLGGDALDYSEYETIFVGRIMETAFTKTEFFLEIESKAFALLRLLPINNYWTSNYADMDPTAEGKPIPYFWGSYNAAQAPLCTCIDDDYDINSSQWKICDCTYHEILSITQVYVDFGAGAGWETMAHANEDLANATFTIETKPVWGVTRVKVAFEGYHSGSVLIEGAPEIVEDILLNQCGMSASDLDAASFVASKASSATALNVHVEDETSALNIIEMICQSDFAFFDEGGDGSLRYRAWEPFMSGTIPVLDETDILDDPEITEDASHLYYRVRIGYSWSGELDELLYTATSSSVSLYKYGRSDHLTLDTYLRDKSAGDGLAQKINWLTRNPAPIISLTLKAGLIDKTLGDKIRITLARAPYEVVGGYDERTFEVIGKDVSCFPLLVNFKARDITGYGDNVGFWMGAAAPAWAAATDQEKDDSGFWCDADGYCLTADSDSLNKSLWW